MLISDGHRPQPTSKKNRRLVLAGAPQEGEPRSETLLDLPSFSLAAIYRRLLLQGKKFIFLYAYTCRWILKLNQFLYFII